MIRFLLAALFAFTFAAPATPREPVRYTPVFAANFPDPFVLPYRGKYLAYATNAGVNVQMAESPDMVSWRPLTDGRQLHDAMPVLPRWAQAGWTWAPEVTPIGGRYVLYFTARERASGRQCVGVATSRDPRGPFRSDAPAPLVCQREMGGSIDPSAFRDADGALYLLYKSDGNNPAVLQPTRIFAQRLGADGLSLVGEAHELIHNEQHWEWRVVESPSMVRDPAGGYVLFYSGNHYGWEADQPLSNYAIGYARCATVFGPCVKAPENPILKSYYNGEGCLSGPGHQTVFTVGAQQYLVFHAWAWKTGCQRSTEGRFMYVAPLSWDGDTPRIGPGLRPR